MNIKVDANIIKKTTKFRKNFSCLSGETPICSAELCIEIKYILLMCQVMKGAILHSNINQKRKIKLPQISRDKQCKDKDTAEEQLMNKILESFQRISELKTLKISKSW